MSAQNDKLVEALEPVEAMRQACIAAVRAEQMYEGSDFPVCNAVVHAIELIPATLSRSDDGAGVLPCDVRLPPATTIGAGCSFETLRSALSTEGRPVHFNDAHPPADALREGDGVPDDVVALVCAGRRIMERGYVSTSIPEEREDADALDKALEAFASRVCWDDDGGTIPEAHADPCTCGLAAISEAPSAGEGIKNIRARADAIAHLTVPEDGNYRSNGQYKRDWRIARDAARAAFEEIAALQQAGER